MSGRSILGFGLFGLIFCLFFFNFAIGSKESSNKQPPTNFSSNIPQEKTFRLNEFQPSKSGLDYTSESSLPELKTAESAKWMPRKLINSYDRSDSPVYGNRAKSQGSENNDPQNSGSDTVDSMLAELNNFKNGKAPSVPTKYLINRECQNQSVAEVNDGDDGTKLPYQVYDPQDPIF